MSPHPDRTTIESSARFGDLRSPSPPTKGGEGRGEEGRLLKSESPLPNPLPVRASRREGEDRPLLAAMLNSLAMLSFPPRAAKAIGRNHCISERSALGR